MLIAWNEGMSFSSQSWPSRMRSGHGVLLVVIHRPERSGCPSLVRGACALRFGWPFGSLGTSGVAIVIHCAAAGVGSAVPRRATKDVSRSTHAAPVGSCRGKAFMDRVYSRESSRCEQGLDRVQHDLSTTEEKRTQRVNSTRRREATARGR